MKDLKVDSKEGIQHMMDWARAHKFVLYPYHRDIAQKYGVGVDGVHFADPLNTTS